MILVFALYALLASTFSLGKLLLQFTTPLFLIGIRMLIAGTILLLMSLTSGSKLKMTRKDFLFFWAASFVHILIPYTAEFWALQYISASKACLYYNLSPFFAALFSYLVFKETMTWKKWIGFMIGLYGMYYFLAGDVLYFSFSVFSLPDLSILFSVISSSFGWILVRLLVKNRGYSPLYVNSIAMLLGGAASMGLSYRIETNYGVLPEDIPQFMVLLFATILIANIVFYNLYGFLLRKYTATFLSFAGFLTPVFAAFFEKMIFSTPIPSTLLYSVGIIGVGITLFYLEDLKQGYIAS